MKIFTSVYSTASEDDVAGVVLPGTGTRKDPSNITRVALFDLDGRVLVKFMNDNTVDLPGGHVEANESMLDVVNREVFEETGCTTVMPAKRLGVDTPVVYFRKEYCRVYLYGAIVNSSGLMMERAREQDCDRVEFIHPMQLKTFANDKRLRDKTLKVIEPIIGFYNILAKKTIK